MSILKTIGKVVAKKAKEPSTYVGVATIGGILGLGHNFNTVVQAIGLIVGGGLVTHTESERYS